MSSANQTTSNGASTTPGSSSSVSSSSPSLSSTTTLPPSTSITSLPSSTTTIPPSTSSLPPTTIVTQVTSVFTAPSTSSQGPVITTITSTSPVVTFTPSVSDVSTTSRTSTSASSTPSALSPSASGNGSGGLSSGATIAIAVVIPIVAVIGLVVFGLWFWRRRKAKKNAEELRKSEMAEYGYNPNNDPTLPVGAAYTTDGVSEGNDDSGYRGWGATSTSNRKASTTLGSNSRAAAVAGIGTAVSDAGSQGGYGIQPSPSAGNASDGLSQDPLVHGYPDANMTGAAGAAAVGGAAAAGGAYQHTQPGAGVHRGPSNASSAYSGVGARSEASSDAPDVPRPYHQEEVPYNIYNDIQPGHGPYGDGTYGAQNDQPVIRDVQARRNTRIERAPTFPQQGGIAQNF